MDAALISNQPSNVLCLIENVSHARGYKLVLKDFSLQIKAGELMVLRGSNGSGKSTVLQIIAGLISPQIGVTSRVESYHYLGHESGLLVHLTVAETLSHTARYFDSLAEIEQIGDNLNLNALRDRQVYTLSAGQQRRLALARVILSKSKLWVLDEPLTNLDKDSSSLIYTMIHQHCRAGGGVIMASHESVPEALMAQERWLDD